MRMLYILVALLLSCNQHKSRKANTGQKKASQNVSLNRDDFIKPSLTILGLKESYVNDELINFQVVNNTDTLLEYYIGLEGFIDNNWQAICFDINHPMHDNIWFSEIKPFASVASCFKSYSKEFRKMYWIQQKPGKILLRFKINYRLKGAYSNNFKHTFSNSFWRITDLKLNVNINKKPINLSIKFIGVDTSNLPKLAFSDTCTERNTSTESYYNLQYESMEFLKSGFTSLLYKETKRDVKDCFIVYVNNENFKIGGGFAIHFIDKIIELTLNKQNSKLNSQLMKLKEKAISDYEIQSKIIK